MPGIADTIQQLQASAKGAYGSVVGRPNRLERLSEFGSNPGALSGWLYAPPEANALVVVLHGCTQTAATYDFGSGWTDLAERHGFAVLLPEQQRVNNPNLCFNWFLADDIGRNAGETLSIRQMIEAVCARSPIDPNRIFVTGLSAGGAMANALLATYPEVFSGGSIIAGLPFGAATSIPQALDRMRGGGHMDGTAYADMVRRASKHTGPWPFVSVWHGDADRTVSVVNADAIIAQWRSVHGAAEVPHLTDLVDGQRHRLWYGKDSRKAVEDYRIAGMGHGTPLKTKGEESCGVAGAYMLDVGTSSTWRQAQEWGLLVGCPPSAPVETGKTSRAATLPESGALGRGSVDTLSTSINATISHALKSAGVLK